MDDSALRPSGVTTHTEKIRKTSTSGFAQETADDLMPINNAPHVRRSAAGADGSQGRGRAHTLPHDYGLQVNNSPGCERRRRRQRLAQQYNATQTPAAEMSAKCQDMADADSASGLTISSTFPPSPCHSSFQSRRRLQSLDGGMTTASAYADLNGGTPASTFSAINGGHMKGPKHVHAEADDTHQISTRSSTSRDLRWRAQSFFTRRLVLVPTTVMVVCLVVSSVMTAGSQDRSLAISEQSQLNAGRYDPEVRFLPGMRMEIIARANEDEVIMEGEGGLSRTLAAPSNEEVKGPEQPQRVVQVNGNGRKKRRPRLAHARASFEPTTPSQGVANNGIGSSGLRGDVMVQTPRRKLPTFVLPPEEAEGSGRNSMKTNRSIDIGKGMSWSRFLILVAMAVLCVQLLISLRQG